MPRPRLPLYFFTRLALRPQTREPTAAPSSPTARALRKPMGSGGAMSWWYRWPTHGGKGLKPVEGRAAWLMWLLCVVVAITKNPPFEHLFYCRQDYVCRGFNKDKKNWEVYRLFCILSVFHPLTPHIFHPLSFFIFSHYNIIFGNYFSLCDQLIFLRCQKLCVSRLTAITHIPDLTEEFSVCTFGTLRRKG